MILFIIEPVHILFPLPGSFHVVPSVPPPPWPSSFQPMPPSPSLPLGELSLDLAWAGPLPLCLPVLPTPHILCHVTTICGI